MIKSATERRRFLEMMSEVGKDVVRNEGLPEGFQDMLEDMREVLNNSEEDLNVVCSSETLFFMSNIFAPDSFEICRDKEDMISEVYFLTGDKAVPVFVDNEELELGEMIVVPADLDEEEDVQGEEPVMVVMEILKKYDYKSGVLIMHPRTFEMAKEDAPKHFILSNKRPMFKNGKVSVFISLDKREEIGAIDFEEGDTIECDSSKEGEGIVDRVLASLVDNTNPSDTVDLEAGTEAYKQFKERTDIWVGKDQVKLPNGNIVTVLLNRNEDPNHMVAKVRECDECDCEDCTSGDLEQDIVQLFNLESGVNTPDDIVKVALKAMNHHTSVEIAMSHLTWLSLFRTNLNKAVQRVEEEGEVYYTVSGVKVNLTNRVSGKHVFLTADM